MVQFYLDKELFSEQYRETAINYTVYAAVRLRKETGNKHIDFDTVIWDREIPEIIDTLKRMGETEFTISTNMSSLVETLACFNKFGVEIAGMTEINSRYTDSITSKRTKTHAILMKVN